MTYSQFVSGVLIWSCLHVCSKIKTGFKTGSFWVRIRCLEDIVQFHKIGLSSHLRGRLEKLAKNGKKSLRLSWWSRQPRVMQTAWKKKRIWTHFFTCLYQVNHLSWRQGFKTCLQDTWYELAVNGFFYKFSNLSVRRVIYCL